TVQGGAPSTGTVTLTAAAPSGGAAVTLSSTLAAASVPASVTVAAGASSATFSVATTAVASAASATVTASYGGATRTATLALTPPPPPPVTLASLTVDPPEVQGGGMATGTAMLSGPAPAGGVQVALSSSSAAATVPLAVAVTAGSTTATFTVTTSVVTTSTPVTLTASLAGLDRTATLTVTPGVPPPPPVRLASLTLDPDSVVSGQPSTGTATLTGAAPAGGLVVALSADLSSVTVPSQVTVAEAATSAGFAIATTQLSAKATVIVTGVGGGITRTAALTVAADPCALRTPGAQWLAFSSKRTGIYQVWAMRDDGTCLRQVTQTTSDALFATWSPAGTIAFMSAQSGTMQVYVRDFTTGAESRVDVGALTATSPAFSPDGQSLAFEGYEPGVSAVADIYVVPSAGGTPSKVTTGQKYSAGPAWSPDGAILYFVSNRPVGGVNVGYSAWNVPAAGGAETMIAGTQGILGRPAPTPDGAGLAYTLSASGEAFSQVVIQTLGTGAIRTVTAQKDAEPAFDRTGARMVVTSQRGVGADLLLLDTATGAVVRQLTDDPGIDGLAAYGPFP
ncbi:MAG: hypothetical protein WB493_01180, partial [Anaeromyxobacteraceae bacterium]